MYGTIMRDTYTGIAQGVRGIFTRQVDSRRLAVPVFHGGFQIGLINQSAVTAFSHRNSILQRLSDCASIKDPSFTGASAKLP